MLHSTNTIYISAFFQEMFYSGDNIGAVVADIGSFACRVGFAGEDSPRAYFPTAIAECDKQGSHSQFSPFKYSPGVKIKVPTHESVIGDWEGLERLWDYAIRSFVKTDVAGLPVLVAEKPYNTPELRHKLCELMFEHYQASAFFLAKDSTLACYACGKTSGIVVDCGASGTLVTPVIDGWSDMKAVIKSPVGGRMMDAYMLNLVSKKVGSRPRPNYRLLKSINDISGSPLVVDMAFNEPVHSSFDAYMNLELGRDVKESVTVCCADGSLSQAESRLSILPTTPYELPDGTIVDMGIERFQVPELFFDRVFGHDGEIENLYSASIKLPIAMPLSSDNIPQIIQNSLYRCELDGSMNNMWQNIILSGGNSCYKGLQDRLKVELDAKSPQNTRVKIIAVSDIERSSDKADKMKSIMDRAMCPWLGGSIMGSLGSFHEIWISRKDYDEYGANIVDSKCP